MYTIGIIAVNVLQITYSTVNWGCLFITSTGRARISIFPTRHSLVAEEANHVRTEYPLNIYGAAI